jgi:hypothetical protein
MKRSNLTTAAVALAIAVVQTTAAAQSGERPYLQAAVGEYQLGGTRPHLHTSSRWDECSIQLDASLTQKAWRQFTQEAGLVAYFRPLSDAKPMGKGKFEVSVLQWDTGIDDSDAAWNDTFVHPDSTHWLFEGSGLKFPGLMVRAGVSNKTDVGIYATKNPNANYGFFGAQVQQNLVGGANSSWDAATRLSVTSLFGPEDVNLAVIGWDLIASREFALTSWAAVSPYVGVSSYFSMSRESSPVVTLDNENVGGSQAMAGAVLQLSGARLAIEYNAAKVNSLSMKVGFGR